MEDSKSKITFRERAAYGLGDFASSMFWKLFSMFLLFFYTDVFGISAAAVGTMFLITRVWDAANDPLMGILADRTHSKWGKFRPYLLFVAVPFAIVGVLTFSTPDLDDGSKLIYAYVTYSLMMMVYTAINVPYSSLMGVMTSDPGERTTLASFRFIGAFSGGLLVTATANSLIGYLGDEDQAVGFQATVGIYAVIAAILFWLTFAGTRERLKPVRSQKPSLRDDLGDIAKNGPWFVMLGAGISILIFNSIRDGSILYYFKYYVKDQTFSFLGVQYELTHTVLSSAYMSTWLATNIIGVLLAKPISSRLGKKRTFAMSAILSALFSFTLFFFHPGQIGWIFFSNALVGI
ncbi:MAG: glycoside-pentoside-hexuronide (GPH):cation symporter, partial [Cytophagales bacterium]|nr:glycoside-pentoside-hexuronide (GPH):cation symporter [Cytophagales bacterium]